MDAGSAPTTGAGLLQAHRACRPRLARISARAAGRRSDSDPEPAPSAPPPRRRRSGSAGPAPARATACARRRSAARPRTAWPAPSAPPRACRAGAGCRRPPAGRAEAGVDGQRRPEAGHRLVEVAAIRLQEPQVVVRLGQLLVHRQGRLELLLGRCLVARGRTPPGPDRCGPRPCGARTRAPARTARPPGPARRGRRPGRPRPGTAPPWRWDWPWRSRRRAPPATWRAAAGPHRRASRRDRPDRQPVVVVARMVGYRHDRAQVTCQSPSGFDPHRHRPVPVGAQEFYAPRGVPRKDFCARKAEAVSPAQRDHRRARGATASSSASPEEVRLPWCGTLSTSLFSGIRPPLRHQLRLALLLDVAGEQQPAPGEADPDAPGRRRSRSAPAGRARSSPEHRATRLDRERAPREAARLGDLRPRAARASAIRRSYSGLPPPSPGVQSVPTSKRSSR